jgi:hypothetical protein
MVVSRLGVLQILGFLKNLGAIATATAFLVLGTQAANSQSTKRDPPDNSFTTPPALPQVTIKALSEAERRRLDRAIPSFIQSHAVPALFGQYARWTTPICVMIAGGLPPSFVEFVTRRIAELADSVGAHASRDPNCKPNVQVFFAAQPQKQLDEVVRTAPELLGYYYKSQTKDIATFSGPIRTWYSIGGKGLSGRLKRLGPNDRAPDGVAGSRLSSGAGVALMTVLVIADGKKMAGYEIGPVSDYIAMLVLSQIPRSDQCVELNSILDLFATECNRGDGPKELTPVDVAFLKALYSTNLELVGALERGNIHNMMLRALAKGSGN